MIGCMPCSSQAPEKGEGRVFVPCLNQSGKPGASRHSQARNLIGIFDQNLLPTPQAQPSKKMDNALQTEKDLLHHLASSYVKPQHLGRQVGAVLLKDVDHLGWRMFKYTYFK